MRTTFALEDAILEEARKKALEEHLSLAKYIESALKEKLAGEVRETAVPYRALKTFRGDGLVTGVDLNDSAALGDLLESPE